MCAQRWSGGVIALVDMCACAVVVVGVREVVKRWCSSHSSTLSRSNSTCVHVIIAVIRRVSMVAGKVVVVLSTVLVSMCAVVAAR